MLFGLIVTATLAALFAGIMCYVLKVTNSYLVLLIQFLVSWGASYGIAYWLSQGVFTEGYIALVCAVISTIIFAVLLLAQKLLGPLNSRRPGSLAKKLQQHHHKRHHHGQPQ